MKKDIVLIGALVLLLFFLSTAHATVWYVHPDSALNSIQTGLDSCADNDTVLVGPGIYYENIIWPNTQGIDLVSRYGPDTTIIDGNNTGRVIEITTGVDTLTVIKGFTIRNGFATGYPGGGGIGCYWYTSPTITGNTITGNTATYGGIYCEYGTPKITNNTITDNTGGGILCDYGSPKITYNTITANTGDGIGYWNYWGDSITIASNSITNNTGNGIEMFKPGRSNIIGNAISGNTGWGISIEDAWGATITNNTVTGNTGGGIRVGDTYGATVTNNIVTGNTGGGIILWSGEWGGGGGTIANNIITGNKAMYGGGILTGGPEVSAFIIGNTIADNIATQGGGGIYLKSYEFGDIELRVMNNTITNNTAAYGGGIGIWIPPHDLPTSVSIIENTITDNVADFGGGIWYSDSSEAWEYPDKIINNTIIGNTALYGGGILCAWSFPNIMYCTISANYGDGVYCEDGSNPLINYNNINDNSGYGVYNVGPSVLVDGCNNWWGDSSGPGGVGPGSGDEVSEWVSYTDWFTRPVILRDTLDFKPNTFNKKRHGKFVTIYLELRDGYNPEDIDPSKLRLHGNVPGYVSAEPKPTCVGDYDHDGYPDRMIKFNADLVNDILSVGDSVKVSLEYDTGDWWWIWKHMLVDYVRVIEPGGTQAVDSEKISEFCLASVYPNPFTGSTAIRFSNSHNIHVTLRIFDISGRLIRTLVNRKVDTGTQTTTWDCTDNSGKRLPSGVYFLKLNAGDCRETRKLILLR